MKFLISEYLNEELVSIEYDSAKRSRVYTFKSGRVEVIHIKQNLIQALEQLNRGG